MRFRAVAIAVCVLVLGACGSSGHSSSTPTTKPGAQAQPAPATTLAAPAPQPGSGKPAGRGANLKHADVCPVKQTKHTTPRCLSTVATDNNGTALHFVAPRNSLRFLDRKTYSLQGVNGVVWGFGPSDFHKAYNVPWSSPVQQTIAIVLWGDDPTVKSDLDVYNKAFGLPAFPTCVSTGWAPCFQKVNQNGAASPLPPVDNHASGEIALDVEIAHSMCLNCKILLVEAQTNDYANIAAAENTAARLGATEINNSFGAGEDKLYAGLDLGPDPEMQKVVTTYASAFNHPGVAITASTGDDGADVGPQFPADLNTVVAVGGTDLSLNKDNSYLSETAHPDGGSGCSNWVAARTFQTANRNWASTGCGNRRAASDVSADYVDAWIYTTSYNERAVSGGWYLMAGTSLSSPLVAAIYALAGNAWRVSYPAQFAYQNTGSLHDINGGSNGSCNSIMCNAGTGYDGPTGLGSPNGLGAF